MSLPPSTIRIKRKLDEAPVQALYVDRSETKRQKVKKDFVFRLARTVASPTDPTPQPFQPQHFPRSSGIPQVRSTLTPASRSRPGSPSVGIAGTPLISRTPSPGHGIGPLPPGSKLALDTSSVSEKRAKARVPLSAIARADSYGSNVESPGVITPASAAEETISTTPQPEAVDDSEGPVRKGTFGSDKTHSLSTSPVGSGAKPVPSPSTTAGKRKAAAAVRRYHLAKRLRIKHPHPYSSAATRRSAIFVRASSEPPVEDVSTKQDVEMERETAIEEPVVFRKRPRTHPEEKRRIEEKRLQELEKEKQRQKEKEEEQEQRKVRFEEKQEIHPLTIAMQNMVFEYLNSEQNDGIRNLPPTTTSPRGTPKKSNMQEKIGGGLGGGTWKDMDKGEIDGEPEDEDGFVYDVYIREEVNPGSKKDGEDYGLIVIHGSDDEEWWYEGDDDIDSDDVYGSDDEDSNAEDYHTNDYPEEPIYDSDADEVDEFDVLGDDSADDGDEDDSGSDAGVLKSRRNKPRKGDDEEYDLEYDEDVDVEAEGMRKKMADIWGYREGGRMVGKEVDSGDEMED